MLSGTPSVPSIHDSSCRALADKGEMKSQRLLSMMLLLQTRHQMADALKLQGLDPERVATWTTVDPYGLLAKAGRWYLVADMASVPRLYSLQRLNSWEVLITITATLSKDRLDLARRILGSRLASGKSCGSDKVEITVFYYQIPDTRYQIPDRSRAAALAIRRPPPRHEPLRGAGHDARRFH